MHVARVNTNPDPLRTALFRSVTLPFCHKTACTLPLELTEDPTSCPKSFSARACVPVPEELAALEREESGCIAPFCHRKPTVEPLAISAHPTTSPPVLTELAVLCSPPSVPKSVITPLSQVTART